MAKDKCVMCGSETEYEFSTHIDLRTGYIEGMGQLCFSCYTGKSRNHIVVDYRTIIDTPNDLELGGKIRKIFFEDSGITPQVTWEKID